MTPDLSAFGRRRNTAALQNVAVIPVRNLRLRFGVRALLRRFGYAQKGGLL